MSIFSRPLLGSGRFRDTLRTELELEGIELIEEGVGGSLRYTRFKAPGRRFDGKIEPQRFARST